MRIDTLHGQMRNLTTLLALTMVLAGGIVVAGTYPVGAANRLAPAAREEAPADLANHPMVGAWMAMTPAGPAPAIFAADGTVIMGVQPTQAGPQGVAFVSAEVGTWEPTGEHSVHFTAVQVLSDANGAYLGTVTIDGHPTVNADGKTIRDDSPETTVTIRDATNTIVDVISGELPVTGIRMGVGEPGFPEEIPAAATPAASGSDADLVRATEHARLRALVAADHDLADQLHADDFQLVNPFGETLTKEEYLGAIASGAIDYLVFEPTSNIEVRLFDEVAAIRYQSRIEIGVDGEPISTRGWHTDLYELHDGRWQAVWSQMTAIA